MVHHHNCAVAVCKNHGEMKDMPPDLVFHVFPKNASLKKQWLMKCKQGNDQFNCARATVCSAHFCPEDYERDLKSELCGNLYKPKRKLKRDAVPSLNLDIPDGSTQLGALPTPKMDPHQKPVTAVITDRQMRCEARGSKRNAQTISPTKKTRDQMTQTDFNDPEKESLRKKLKLAIANLRRVLASKEELRQKTNKLVKENTALRAQLRRYCPRVSKKRKREMERQNEPPNTKQELWMRKNSEVLMKKLREMYTPQQLKFLIKTPNEKGRKLVNWQPEDIAKALALRNISSRAYEYVRANGLIPLPSVTTLKERRTPEILPEPEVTIWTFLDDPNI